MALRFEVLITTPLFTRTIFTRDIMRLEEFEFSKVVMYLISARVGSDHIDLSAATYGSEGRFGVGGLAPHVYPCSWVTSSLSPSQRLVGNPIMGPTLLIFCTDDDLMMTIERGKTAEISQKNIVRTKRPIDLKKRKRPSARAPCVHDKGKTDLRSDTWWWTDGRGGGESRRKIHYNLGAWPRATAPLLAFPFTFPAPRNCDVITARVPRSTWSSPALRACQWAPSASARRPGVAVIQYAGAAHDGVVCKLLLPVPVPVPVEGNPHPTMSGLAAPLRGAPETAVTPCYSGHDPSPLPTPTHGRGAQLLSP
ncbi:hypothetical protein BJV78DRAFT_450190 [Lactifluus subvellereus]|nr:hypothetical protein BJV78DRAFT_450190 [Lactifluus subvellereus]